MNLLQENSKLEKSDDFGKKLMKFEVNQVCWIIVCPFTDENFIC